MSGKKDRRDFLKIAAVGAVSVAASPLLVKGVAAAGVPESPKLMKDAAAADTMRINPNAKAVLPSGKLADRRGILSQLGLDPSTPIDAWLCICSCAVNAAALTDRTRKQLKLKEVQMDIEGGRG